MCGIIAYTGKKEAYGILLKGLKTLQYRGYDSAGIAVAKDDIQINKSLNLADLSKNHIHGETGIGHTRWSTCGSPTLKNAHPFIDCKKQIVLAHNGTIENYLELKKHLKNHKFTSDTDSEVILHLIEDNYRGDLREAVEKTTKKLQGTYALFAMTKDCIVATKHDMPIVLGKGKSQNMAASDVLAICGEVDEVSYLKDHHTAVITKKGITSYDMEGKEEKLDFKKLDNDSEEASKGEYKHFMLKEIMDQHPLAIKWFKKEVEFQKPGRILFVACGTAYHAALIGKYLAESRGVEASAEVASEFRYRKMPVRKDDLFIAISQSGETADTLAALRQAKRMGMKTAALVNVPSSTMAREADVLFLTDAGHEISVASTKAFLSQLAMIHLIFAGKGHSLMHMPEKINEVLKERDNIRKIAEKYAKCKDFLYIGRGMNYPIALEGALKLKEISYLHAEGYPAGEMKHGPIAMTTPETGVIAIVPQDDVYEKTISNISELQARQGKILAIATRGDKSIVHHANDVIFVPEVDDEQYPLLTAIAVQLIAYYIADYLGRDIDKPRNLAKSVTVE